ncbi:MAG: SusF/SusE family outer membrane protein [Tenuifilaceae bacterium]|nr:SusF/SusE family outer membrane protein [Tenuifilaceae bacterium]
MKKVNLSKFFKLTWAMLMIVGLAFVVTSCKDDDDDDVDPNKPIVLDGVYVKGGSTALADFDVKGKMKVTRNEVNQKDRAQLMEIYVAVKAGSPGFSIVSVAGDTKTSYGPGADFAVVPADQRDGDEPQVDFWRGSYAVTETAFTVPVDGLYHVVIDTEVKKVVIAPVQWGVIGAATPGGWGTSTPLTAAGFDLNTMTFEANDMTLTKADYKFRYSNGWKIILDPDFDLGGGEKGIRVNTNFGGSPAALVPGGDNIPNAAPGKYTVKMVWTLGSGYAASVVKTGDLQITDYTNTSLGLVGDGLMVDGAQHNWDVTIMLQEPAVENETTYIWTYSNVSVSTLGSFKIREGQDWTKKSIGYNDVTMAGLSKDKFETNGDGNFVPTEDGVYDMVLKIDAVTETYTFTVNPAGVATELYMLGDGCSAGWDNGLALPMNGTNGLYTITAPLNGAGTAIKFITTLGQWAPMYGTDGTATSTNGPLVYRATESDPDPANIPAPDAVGSYLITVNTTDMTYTIAAAK